MVIMTSFQVGIVSLKHPKFGMTDTSLDNFDLEYFYQDQVLIDVWPFICNKISQTASSGLKYHPSDAVTKVAQVYKHINDNTTCLNARI